MRDDEMMVMTTVPLAPLGHWEIPWPHLGQPLCAGPEAFLRRRGGRGEAGRREGGGREAGPWNEVRIFDCAKAGGGAGLHLCTWLQHVTGTTRVRGVPKRAGSVVVSRDARGVPKRGRGVPKRAFARAPRTQGRRRRSPRRTQAAATPRRSRGGGDAS